MRPAIAIGVVLVMGCKDRAPPGAPSPTPVPAVEIGWAAELSVYDVLGRDRSLIQLIQVPRRPLPDGVTVHPAAGSSPFHVVTVCDSRACTDGVITGDQLDTAGHLAPCARWTERTPPAGGATRPGAACEFVLLPSLTADDREILDGGDGDGSWLERGVKITYATPGTVSYLLAEAYFTAGAAHSHAELSCRTQSEHGLRMTLGELPGVDAAALAAIAAFFAQAREEYDDRARGTDGIGADYAEILADGPRSFALCLPGQEGVGAQVRVELPREIASLDAL